MYSPADVCKSMISNKVIFFFPLQNDNFTFKLFYSFVNVNCRHYPMPTLMGTVNTELKKTAQTIGFHINYRQKRILTRPFDFGTSSQTRLLFAKMCNRIVR